MTIVKFLIGLSILDWVKLLRSQSLARRKCWIRRPENQYENRAKWSNAGWWERCFQRNASWRLECLHSGLFFGGLDASLTCDYISMETDRAHCRSSFLPSSLFFISMPRNSAHSEMNLSRKKRGTLGSELSIFPSTELQNGLFWSAESMIPLVWICTHPNFMPLSAMINEWTKTRTEEITLHQGISNFPLLVFLKANVVLRKRSDIQTKYYLIPKLCMNFDCVRLVICHAMVNCITEKRHVIAYHQKSVTETWP